MTEIEERLRRELRREADRARSELLRPLRPVTEGGRRRWGPAWRGHPGRAVLRGWLTPVAAMLAVAVVIGGVTLGVGALAARPAVTSSAGVPGRGMPPYYVTVGFRRASQGGRWLALVHDATTGQVLHTVTLPRSDGPPLVTGSGNGRVLVVGVSPRLWSSRFYLLRLGLDGTPGRLRPLPLAAARGPLGSGALQAMALSPGGARLAVVEVSVAAHVEQRVMVVAMASGAVRSWRMPPGPVLGLTWTVGGRLGMWWERGWGLSWTGPAGEPPGYAPPGPGKLLVLDTTAPGRTLSLSQAVALRPGRTGRVIQAMLMPSGTAVIAAIRRRAGTTVPERFYPPSIVELSARTGRTLRVLYRPAAVPAAPAAGPVLLALDASGSDLLMNGQTGFGRLGNGRYLRLAARIISEDPFTVAW